MGGTGGGVGWAGSAGPLPLGECPQGPCGSPTGQDFCNFRPFFPAQGAEILFPLDPPGGQGRVEGGDHFPPDLGKESSAGPRLWQFSNTLLFTSSFSSFFFQVFVPQLSHLSVFMCGMWWGHGWHTCPSWALCLHLVCVSFTRRSPARGTIPPPPRIRSPPPSAILQPWVSSAALPTPQAIKSHPRRRAGNAPVPPLPPPRV